MEIYIINNRTFEIEAVTQASEYNLNLDEETNAVSSLKIINNNNIQKGNYVVLNGLYKQFIFVVSEDVFANDKENTMIVPLLDISNIFDRNIILKEKEIMKTKGIETFIANNIKENFINSDDNVLNLNYIKVNVLTTTKSNVDTNEENNLYNFHTFITNCRQYKDIYCEFKFNKNNLEINILHKDDSVKLVDTTLDEVVECTKIYEVDPVTRVEAYIQEDNTTYNLYLKNDRTTTTEKNDANRMYGRIETISCSNLESAKEQSLNTIKANRYRHLVEFKIGKSSNLVDVTQLYIGRKIKIKTKDSIYDSYISAIVLNDDNFIQFKSGNLRIDFTDKQRQSRRSK